MAEWDALHEAVVQWLTRCDVAGSIGGEYSLYRALDDERERATVARRYCVCGANVFQHGPNGIRHAFIDAADRPPMGTPV